MLISVIVPVYNVEKYLRQCLDSLLRQTYKELEIILVDDGSLDNSGRICDEYGEKNSNFKVIHKENAGLGMARNTGLENVNGELVTFVDSDDYLDLDCIEALYNGIVQNNVDMCKAGFKRVIDSGKVISNRKYANEIFEGDNAKLNLLPRMIGSSPSQHDSVEMCVCGAIYKTSNIVKYGLKFPSERELISEDLVFNIDYMQYAKGACIIENLGYNYRINIGSLSTCYRENRFEASKFFYSSMRDKIINLNYQEETILRLDRMFFVYLRMCIGQERKAISTHNFWDRRSRIKKICEDSIVRKIIKEYPVNILKMRQRVFIYLIKFRMSIIINVLNEMGLT